MHKTEGRGGGFVCGRIPFVVSVLVEENELEIAGF